MTEEYVADFASAMGGLFALTHFSAEFFTVTFVLVFGVIWLMTGFGLIYRHPVANFLLWFFICGPGLTNGLSHFAFPFIAGTLYFPGVITVIVPIVCSTVLAVKLLKGEEAAETPLSLPNPR